MPTLRSVDPGRLYDFLQAHPDAWSSLARSTLTHRQFGDGVIVSGRGGENPLVLVLFSQSSTGTEPAYGRGKTVSMAPLVLQNGITSAICVPADLHDAVVAYQAEARSSPQDTDVPPHRSMPTGQDGDRNERPVQIEEFCNDRGINDLWHFTPQCNLDGIMQHGLLSRTELERRGLANQVSYNDDSRYDGQLDAVCISISFPNYKMFYGLRCRKPDCEWVVLRLNASILWQLPCAFCQTNAAAMTVSQIPIAMRIQFQALADMFAETVDGRKRSNLSIPDRYTTNPQAEVLVLDAVSTQYIREIHFAKDIPGLPGWQERRQNYKLVGNSAYFSYRQDYEHWKSTRIVE